MPEVFFLQLMQTAYRYQVFNHPLITIGVLSFLALHFKLFHPNASFDFICV